MRGRKPAKWKEKELEDYTLSNLRKLVDVIHPLSYLESCWSLIGRQIRCHVGVIDALILCGRDLYVCEFKATKASERTVGQLERYRTAIHRIGQRHASVMQFALPTMAVKTLIVAPDFSHQVLGSVDSCIKTHKARGEFAYDRINMPDFNTALDLQLVELIEPLYSTLRI